MSFSTRIKAGARGSALSRAQLEEVLHELRQYHPEVAFDPIWMETTGDIDLKTSLRHLEKTDLFTKEIDTLQLLGHCRISIHSAKDLPDPLPHGLELIALTKGVDPSDSIVLRDNEWLHILRGGDFFRFCQRESSANPSPEEGAVWNNTAPSSGEGFAGFDVAKTKKHTAAQYTLPNGAKIGTSSVRREQNVKALREDLVCVDIRGTILTRLALLDRGDVDGVVIAEAALIRLKLTHRQRILLPGPRAALQGQLAILALERDEEMRELFRCIDGRQDENNLISRDRSGAL